MTAGGCVLLGPVGLLEADCVRQLLEASGIAVVTEPGPRRPTAAVAVGTRAVPGTQTVRELRRASPGIPVLLVTADADGPAADTADTGEAAGVVGWAAGGQAIVDAVTSLAGGGARARRPAAHTGVPDPLCELTAREQEVLLLLSRGRRNGEIAGELGISQHTARTHVQHVLGKLGVSHRHAAAAVARRGLTVRVPATGTAPVSRGAS